MILKKQKQSNGVRIKVKQPSERLDKFLTNELKDSSRSQIQKLIKEGSITVNSKPANAHYKLKVGDIIEIKKEKKKIAPEKKVEKYKTELNVIADTPEYVVINKPSGVIMHEAEHIKGPTLVNAILKKYPEVKKIGENPFRPGIVHRLDKEVSGLSVIAKTQDSFDSLKKQFQERTIQKEYTALVYGTIEKEESEINFPIARSSAGYKMAALPRTTKEGENEKGRRAITEFKIIKKYINYTLLKIKIKTGRTHQIRVHMSAYGHPIVGDNLYGTRRTKEQNKKIGLGRIFLFADKLSFTDLKGKKQTFKITMPEELKKALEKIK